MKKLYVIPFLLCFFIACTNDPKLDPAKEAGNIATIDQIKKNEPRVLESFITEANVLYVAVKSDGTNRDGFAGYFCDILAENKASCHWVKVVEYNTASKETGYGNLLGESKCN